MTKPALLPTLTPHVLSPQSSFSLLLCKHLQLPIARFPTPFTFLLPYFLALPLSYDKCSGYILTSQSLEVGGWQSQTSTLCATQLI